MKNKIILLSIAAILQGCSNPFGQGSLVDSKLSAELTGSYLYTSEAAGTSASGLKTQFGLTYIQRFEFGQFTLSSRYGLRSQNFGEFKFSEQIADYGVGYHYLF